MLSATLATLTCFVVPPPDAPKIHAQVSPQLRASSVVIKRAEDVTKTMLKKLDADKANAELAKMLKVDSIDWKKQMVIVVSGGERPTGGFSVEVKSLEVKDGKLIVHWKLNSPGADDIVAQVITYPAQLILVDRFEGKVEFDPPAKK